MFRSDTVNGQRVGGVLLCVKTELNAVEIKMKSQFTDQVCWCKLKVKNGEDLLIRVCYRSPNVVHQSSRIRFYVFFENPKKT